MWILEKKQHVNYILREVVLMVVQYKYISVNLDYRLDWRHNSEMIEPTSRAECSKKRC